MSHADSLRKPAKRTCSSMSTNSLNVSKIKKKEMKEKLFRPPHYRVKIYRSRFNIPNHLKDENTPRKAWGEKNLFLFVIFHLKIIFFLTFSPTEFLSLVWESSWKEKRMFHLRQRVLFLRKLAEVELRYSRDAKRYEIADV